MTALSRTVGVVVVAAALAACRPAGSQAARTTSGSRGDSRTAYEVEDEILHDLAAIDRRFAMRARVTPSEDDLRRVTMAAMLGEDLSVAVVNGSVDPFSFDARARGLESARKKIAARPPSAQARERELLTRLVDSEVMRLEEERALPRSASALVRAVVETWQAPRGAREAADDDHWLARRLAELREAMTAAASSGSALDVVRARELDDALDALEHLASAPGFTETTQELVRIRDALEAASSHPAAKAQSEWGAVARRVRAHLGVTAPADELARDLAALEAELRKRAEQAILDAHLGGDALSAALEKHLFVSGACVDAVPGSRLRSMAAPQEREPACHLRHLVARADDEVARAIALAAMHGHTVVAQWALDVARGASTIAEAHKHRLLMPVPPDIRARYERIALARPVAAIGAGQTARMLLSEPKVRAMAWTAIGDVPLDIAERELGAR